MIADARQGVFASIAAAQQVPSESNGSSSTSQALATLSGVSGCVRLVSGELKMQERFQLPLNPKRAMRGARDIVDSPHSNPSGDAMVADFLTRKRPEKSTLCR